MVPALPLVPPIEAPAVFIPPEPGVPPLGSAPAWPPSPLVPPAPVAPARPEAPDLPELPEPAPLPAVPPEPPLGLNVPQVWLFSHGVPQLVTTRPAARLVKINKLLAKVLIDDPNFKMRR
jgi:hypothetical protein